MFKLKINKMIRETDKEFAKRMNKDNAKDYSQWVFPACMILQAIFITVMIHIYW